MVDHKREREITGRGGEKEADVRKNPRTPPLLLSSLFSPLFER
jgi:hypothetical protein